MKRSACRDDCCKTDRSPKRHGIPSARYATSSESIDSQTSILVIDLNLESSNGNEAIRRLRDHRVTRQFVMGVCTGSEDPTERKDAHDAGADFFAPKPLVPLGLESICSEVDSLLWLADSADGYPVRRIGVQHRDTF